MPRGNHVRCLLRGPRRQTRGEHLQQFPVRSLRRLSRAVPHSRGFHRRRDPCRQPRSRLAANSTSRGDVTAQPNAESPIRHPADVPDKQTSRKNCSHCSSDMPDWCEVFPCCRSVVDHRIIKKLRGRLPAAFIQNPLAECCRQAAPALWPATTILEGSTPMGSALSRNHNQAL